MRYLVTVFAIALPLFYAACTNPSHVSGQNNGDTIAVRKDTVNRVFNEDSAWVYVFNQVNFGPRVPGTVAHQKCHRYLSGFLRKVSDTVYLQNSTAKTFDGKQIPIMNIIASFNIKSAKRILLAAHWDTRPFADQDSKDREKPIPGANDGGSGVGVLMEIARQLQISAPEIGIDIILFDAEDWGDNSGKVEDSYCLGSQYWSKNPHIQGYKADFGILLDMVGSPNAMFGFEGYSLAEAQTFLSMVWASAASAGYSNYFRNFERGYVTDDHYYIMKHTKIPTIDIIDTDPTTPSHFGKYWHTHQDNMDAIDRNTLKAVGQTVLNVLSAY